MNAGQDSYLFAWLIGLVIIALIICVVIYLLIAQVMSSDRENVDKPEAVNDVDSEKGLPNRATAVSMSEKEVEMEPTPQKPPTALPKVSETPSEPPKEERSTAKNLSPLPTSTETITKSEREAEPPVNSLKKVEKSVKTETKVSYGTLVTPKDHNPPPTSNSCPKSKSLSAEPLNQPENLNLTRKTEVPKPENNRRTVLSAESCEAPEKVPDAKKMNLSSEKIENNEPKSEKKGSAEVVGNPPPLDPPTRLSADTTTTPQCTTTSSTIVSEMSAVVPISSQRSEASHFNLIEAGRTPPNEHSFGSSLVKSSSREILKTTPLASCEGKNSETYVSMTTPPTRNY